VTAKPRTAATPTMARPASALLIPSKVNSVVEGDAVKSLHP
jgi:hypothetical protein